MWPRPRYAIVTLAVPEVDDGVVDGVLGRAQRRDRAVDFVGVGPVVQRVVAKLVGSRL